MTHALDLGLINTEASVRFVEGEGWGIVIERAGRPVASQPRPVCVEHYISEAEISREYHAYDTIAADGGVVTATARIALSGSAWCAVSDRWSITDGALKLAREVRVEGQADGGFLTGIELRIALDQTWRDVDPFAPGMIYGKHGPINPKAIGSKENYADGIRHFIIREDRLPAPLFGLYLADGTHISLLNALPDAHTIAEEGVVIEPVTRIDTRLRTGALGCIEKDSALHIGYWFPGTEGEITYRGREYPFGQVRTWRRVYHPVQDGHQQTFQIVVRLGTSPDFSNYCRETWRWAWDYHKPQVYPQDIEMVRRSSAQLLHDMTHRALNGMTGPYIWSDMLSSFRGIRQHLFAHFTTMGFVGRGPDAGYYLLREAARPETTDDTRRQFRERGTAILDSYASIPMDPPSAEGFDLFTGKLYTSRFMEGTADTLFLRSLCEGAKFMLRAWQTEQRLGHDHPRWLEWGRQIADFLLSRQQDSGGVPRIFVARTGEVFKDSPYSTYNVIPLWTLVFQITGERRYLDAALRAGEFCWGAGHQDFIFVGGTIDNPDVIDKEAGTVSLEAYLALHDVTRDDMWLARARQAADYSETWIYCWNVPMPEDAEDSQIGWKPGVPTVGIQLIASGHSLADDYMAFDVASYAKLFIYTGDQHYYDVARILLHNTKLMTCLPAHPYDLPQYGWQQEHWSVAPSRGNGMNRAWLTWVTCSNIQGILELEDFDAALYARMVGGSA